MKNRRDREFSRLMDIHNERIEAVKQFLIHKEKNHNDFIVCRDVSYRPVSVCSTGGIIPVLYKFAPVFNDKETAEEAAELYRRINPGCIYIAERLSTAAARHIEWLTKQKLEAATLHGLSSRASRPGMKG